MKVIPFTAIDQQAQHFNFFPLEGAGEILLARELVRLQPPMHGLHTLALGDVILVEHLWLCDRGDLHPAYSLATYAATV